MVSAGVKLIGTDLQACLSFDNSNGEPVIAKVGLSIVSEKNARENLETEVIGFDFDAVRTCCPFRLGTSSLCYYGRRRQYGRLEEFLYSHVSFYGCTQCRE